MCVNWDFIYIKLNKLRITKWLNIVFYDNSSNIVHVYIFKICLYEYIFILNSSIVKSGILSLHFIFCDLANLNILQNF